MSYFYRFAIVTAAYVLLAAAFFGQTAPGKKSYTFQGKVEAVDASAKIVRVNGEEVKGWMAAMTMDYKVDDNALLKKVKPGDQIMAPVYDGDLVLHRVQVMQKASGDSKAQK
jgi:Cu/Ag efflux protein CusF